MAATSGRKESPINCPYSGGLGAYTSSTRHIRVSCGRLLDKEGMEWVSYMEARAIGVTPMAIYRHYPDRAQVLNTLADEGFEELAARLTGKKWSGGIEEGLVFEMSALSDGLLLLYSGGKGNTSRANFAHSTGDLSEDSSKAFANTDRRKIRVLFVGVRQESIQIAN